MHLHIYKFQLFLGVQIIHSLCIHIKACSLIAAYLLSSLIQLRVMTLNITAKVISMH